MPLNNHFQSPTVESESHQNSSGRNAEPDGIEEWEEWQQEQDDSANDYYALLGISHDATPNQIRSAYRALSLRFHPDKQPASQRERTTSHFNNILIAYETLMNPHKRAIYDELGVDGLKQKFLEIGVKTMDPDEFKVWLQEQIRKQRVENVISLVNSRGDIIISFDVSGMRLEKLVRTRESGEKEVEFRLITPKRLTKYVVKHSFTLPLEGLGEFLATPFYPSTEASPEKNEPRMKHIPSLSLTASLGGVPVQTEKGWTYISSPGLSVQIGHSFPSLPPKSPLSIASILAGLDFEIASTILPQRVVSTSISKSFGGSRLVFKPTFNSSPLLSPPNIEATYVSSIGKRSSFFMQYNTGIGGKWPLALSKIFAYPSPSSHLSIGWVAMPISESPVVEDLNDEDYIPTPRSNRSKSTETWRITATACPSIGFGGQLGLSWGRTYFVGTPIGSSSSKTSKAPKKSREGIRINVDATIITATALVVKIKATRKIFTNTRMGAGIGVSAGGVIFTIDWSRLGQKISIPVGLASTSGSSVLYGTLAPFLGYALLEWVYLRPRERKLLKKEAESKKRQLMVKVVKNRRRADELVGLMRDSVKLSQQKMLERGGLVILEARYGIGGKDGEWVDVTIPLAGLIEEEQVVIPRGLNKSHLTGFYDPAPGEKKELWVKYLFKGKRHEVTVGHNRGLAIPMKAHLIE